MNLHTYLVKLQSFITELYSVPSRIPLLVVSILKKSDVNLCILLKIISSTSFTSLKIETSQRITEIIEEKWKKISPWSEKSEEKSANSRKKLSLLKMCSKVNICQIQCTFSEQIVSREKVLEFIFCKHANIFFYICIDTKLKFDMFNFCFFFSTIYNKAEHNWYRRFHFIFFWFYYKS